MTDVPSCDGRSGVHHEILDGKSVTLPRCNVFRIRDGLISAYRSDLDATPVYADPEVPSVRRLGATSDGRTGTSL